MISKCDRSKLGFLNSQNLAGERKFLEEVYEELINLYGVEVSYFEHGYQLSAHDFLYGEHVVAPFSNPIKMKVLLNINDDTQLLSVFGIKTQSDCKIIIGIKQFANYLNDRNAEPKVGSLFRLDFMDARPGGRGFPNLDDFLGDIDYCKNPDDYVNALNKWLSSEQMLSWIRSAPIYEITNVKDFAPNQQLNQLGLYSVWYIECIRWDYSYEPLAPRELGSDQVSDETLYGKLSGGTRIPEPNKKYPQNVEDSSNLIWDYDKRGTKDEVYGEF